MNFINDVKILAKNIEYWYCNNPENGAQWYQEARAFAYQLKKKSPSYNIAQICGVIAVLSANTGWGHNQIIAEKYIVGNDYPGHIGRDKALKILRMSNPGIKMVGDVVNGPKTRPFYRNILSGGGDQFLTLDRHAINLAVAKVRHTTKINYTPKRRRLLTSAYRSVAEKYNREVSTIQAITWSNYIA